MRLLSLHLHGTTWYNLAPPGASGPSDIVLDYLEQLLLHYLKTTWHHLTPLCATWGLIGPPRNALYHLKPLWLHTWWPPGTTCNHLGLRATWDCSRPLGTALNHVGPFKQHHLVLPGATWGLMGPSGVYTRPSWTTLVASSRGHLRPHRTIWDCSRPPGSTQWLSKQGKYDICILCSVHHVRT